MITTPQGLHRDSTGTPQHGLLLFWKTPHGPLHVEWTRGGLEVDRKIAYLAGGSTSGPLAVLVQSWSSPCPVLVESTWSPDISGGLHEDPWLTVRYSDFMTYIKAL